MGKQQGVDIPQLDNQAGNNEPVHGQNMSADYGSNFVALTTRDQSFK